MIGQVVAGTSKDVPRKEQARSLPLNLYTDIVIVAGLLIVVAGIVAALIQPPVEWMGVVLFASMAGLSELMSVELFKTSRVRISVSSIVATAGVVTFGPLAGALIHMASGMATVLSTRRSQQNVHPGKDGRASLLRRSSFNTGMFVISTTIAGAVFIGTGGTVGDLARAPNVVPLVACAAADVLCNIVILMGVLVLQTGRHPGEIFQQEFRWGIPINIMGGVLGGGALALAYLMFGPLGVAVFFLPVMATGYSFRLYVDNMKGYVNRLEEVNRTLDQANLGLLETLGAVMDAYDIYTYGHSAQVTVYAEALAQELGLSKKEQEVIVKASLIHDIGKIGIVDSIIGKPELLTAEEYNIVRRHPSLGADILARMNGLQELVPLVKYHHERWDGGGYPDGLKGEEIPLGARIVALADALDALCSDRPYRTTRSFKDVTDEVLACSGAQFDPQVVNAFFAVLYRNGREFFVNSAATVDSVVRARDAALVGTRGRYLKKGMLKDL